MPNLVTHTLFTEDVLKTLNNPLLNSRRKLVITGGQGPDFLFFHNATPSKLMIPSPIRKYGTLFHHEEVNAFYASALDSIRHEKNRKIRDDMIAYTCGHLCHWASDSTVHPLIYARTGNCTGRSAWRHHRYESLLDAALLQYYKKMTIKDYDPSVECLSADLPTARAIARIYGPAIETVYGDKVRPALFVDTLQDWKHMEKVFRDPTNIKKKLLMPAEKVLHLENLVTGFSIPNVCEDNVDICNLLHNEWRNPCTGEIHTESVFDLLEEALQKAVTAITLFLQAVQNPAKETEFLDFLDDRNYDEGLPGNPDPVFFDETDLSF